MSKTVKIILYIAILLLAYFTISSIYKSCNTPKDVDTNELQDDTMTSDEEDEFFDDFDEEEDDNESVISDVISDEIDDVKEEDEIDYTALDKKISGDADELDDEDDWVEEKPVRESTPINNKKPEVRKKTYDSNSGGKFMIVAGSFLVENNADKLVSKLKRMGYNNAEVSVFDESKYYSVIASRTGDRSKAKSIVSALKNKGVDSYVHTRQL